ncbi:MAG: phytoene/squalene synthase family protein [Phycisphaeraceae bacterium]|nr:phytoene/squalene synthase family protein [Phycisphaeraceae bacterium]
MTTAPNNTAGPTTRTPGAAPEEASRAFCERITREQARNFYYGMRLLSEPRRGRMYALYAYMRALDDIVDDPGRSAPAKHELLDRWREATHAPHTAPEPAQIWPAFRDMALACRVPTYLFDDAIEGQRQDIAHQPPHSFEQVREYCYRVAGTVGVACLYIWGFSGGETTQRLAVERGIAFQLTNILRDICEDSRQGRLYLALDDLHAAGVSPATFLSITGAPGARIAPTPALTGLLADYAARARARFQSSAALEERVDPAGRPALVAMTEIYSGLLARIEADPARVLRERVSLSLMRKLRIGWRAVRAG